MEGKSNFLLNMVSDSQKMQFKRVLVGGWGLTPCRGFPEPVCLSDRKPTPHPNAQPPTPASPPASPPVSPSTTESPTHQSNHHPTDQSNSTLPCAMPHHQPTILLHSHQPTQRPASLQPTGLLICSSYYLTNWPANAFTSQPVSPLSTPERDAIQEP